jgi:hypothetical protein
LFISLTQRSFYFFLIHSEMVRLNSAQVIRQTLEQGLVTPGSSVPTLVAMSTDTLSTIRTRVETLIRDMNTKYKGLILVSQSRAKRKSKIVLNEEANSFFFHRAKRWPAFAWPSSCRRKFAPTPAKSSGAFAPTRTRWAAAAVVAQQPVSFGLCAGLITTCPHVPAEKKFPSMSVDAQALLAIFYINVRTNRQNRRSFLSSLLKVFSEEHKEVVVQS